MSQLLNEIHRVGENARDKNLTGYINWPHKQQLYLAQAEIKRQLEMCSTFHGEEEWLASMRAQGKIL